MGRRLDQRQRPRKGEAVCYLGATVISSRFVVGVNEDYDFVQIRTGKSLSIF